MGLPEDDRSMCGLYVWYGLCVADMYDVVHVWPMCVMWSWPLDVM